MTEEETKEVKPKRRGRPKADLVEVITIRKIGLKDRTSEVGETVKIKREDAIVLQDVGAVKVKL